MMVYTVSIIINKRDWRARSNPRLLLLPLLLCLVPSPSVLYAVCSWPSGSVWWWDLAMRLPSGVPGGGPGGKCYRAPGSSGGKIAPFRPRLQSPPHQNSTPGMPSSSPFFEDGPWKVFWEPGEPVCNCPSPQKDFTSECRWGKAAGSRAHTSPGILLGLPVTDHSYTLLQQYF